jgi:4-aminobutyrate aminotransferase-like enzyme
LKKLEEWARKHDMLFILDEVQSSYGRTGRMWAMEHEGIRPDVVAIGKGIGSGVTVSALAGTSDVFSCLQKGEMSSTAGGNPLACAAVIAVLDIMRKERLPAHAARVGAYMKAKLRQVAKRCACIGDVRGTGLVMGVEFVKDRKTKAPAPDLIKPLILACANNGLLVGAVGTYGNVIRVAPPLVISREEIDESVALFEKSVRSLKPEP